MILCFSCDPISILNCGIYQPIGRINRNLGIEKRSKITIFLQLNIHLIENSEEKLPSDIDKYAHRSFTLHQQYGLNSYQNFTVSQGIIFNTAINFLFTNKLMCGTRHAPTHT